MTELASTRRVETSGHDASSPAGGGLGEGVQGDPLPCDPTAPGGARGVEGDRARPALHDVAWGLRISEGGLLVAGTVLLGQSMLAVAQPQAPPAVPEEYVLLAVSKLHVSGPIGFATGSVGVNAGNGELITTPIAPLALNTQDGVIAANKVRLEQRSTCAAFFADTSQGVHECVGVLSQPIPRPQPPLVTDLDGADICERRRPFPECDRRNDVTVDADTQTTLPPGVYGDLTVDGGTLTLEGGGEYVFCDVVTSNGSTVIVSAPSTLFVAGTVTVRLNSQVNPGGSPDDLRIVVDARGKSAANILGGTVQPIVFTGTGAAAGGVAPRATTSCQALLRATLLPSAPAGTSVVARLCAPNQTATLNLFDATILGTFVADDRSRRRRW